MVCSLQNNSNRKAVAVSPVSKIRLLRLIIERVNKKSFRSNFVIVMVTEKAQQAHDIGNFEIKQAFGKTFLDIKMTS